jgi:hypothetical protein
LNQGRGLDYYILNADRQIRNASFGPARGESMPEMTPGAALRQIQQAQAGLKKARQALRLAKGDPQASHGILKIGWESLAASHRILAAIPLEAANDPVMTKQLALQRYATALLVRLRRVARHETIGPDDDDLPDEDEF